MGQSDSNTRDRMRSSGLVLITFFSSALCSPFPGPEAEADPAYGVIKTIKIWDEDSNGRELLEDALEISDEEIDLNALLDQENKNEDEEMKRNEEEHKAGILWDTLTEAETSLATDTA